MVNVHRLAPGEMSMCMQKGMGPLRVDELELSPSLATITQHRGEWEEQVMASRMDVSLCWWSGGCSGCGAPSSRWQNHLPEACALIHEMGGSSRNRGCRCMRGWFLFWARYLRCSVIA